MIKSSGSRLFLQVNGRWYFYDRNDKPLGAGAMGTVYLGRDCQTNELVAIKRVVDQYADIPVVRRRAKDEASLLFRHKNLIEMLGYCEAAPDSGPIFILSKFVRGTTLDKHVACYISNRKDALQRICKCVYPVFDALTYLHSKGIVHMDIKPSNIMIENGFNIRLMDLGIATASSSLGISSPGMVGTPKYAAPEQFYYPDEPHIDITPATDIYELGVTIYELMTGYNPFDSASRDETILKHRTLVLPKSSKIPAAVLGVLRKATAKKPEERYGSASEFKRELDKALKKKPFPWMAAVAVLVVLVLTAVLMLL